MTIGIAAPTPSGIPGFNIAGMWTRAGNAAGVINARQLPSWYNVVRSVPVANGPVSLPPATCGGAEVVVWNYPDTEFGGVSNALTVFGNVNPAGVADTIGNNAGVQVTTGVVVPVHTVGIFWCTTPQSGWTNAWLPGRWMHRLIETA